jgi:hypothetical protein
VVVGTWDGRDGGEAAMIGNEWIAVGIWASAAAISIASVVVYIRLSPARKSSVAVVISALNAVQIMLATLVAAFYLSASTWADWTIGALAVITGGACIVELLITNRHLNRTKGEGGL